MLKRIKANSLLNLTVGQNWLNRYVVPKITTENSSTKLFASNVITIIIIDKSKYKSKNNFNSRRFNIVINGMHNYRKSSNKKIQHKRVQNIETIHHRNILIAQVPDDDIEDYGSTLSDESPPKDLIEYLSKTTQIFLQKQQKGMTGKKVTVTAMCNKFNKQTDGCCGSGTSAQDYGITEHMRNPQARYFKKWNDQRPTFKNAMTWINMMCGDREWGTLKLKNVFLNDSKIQVLKSFTENAFVYYYT